MEIDQSKLKRDVNPLLKIALEMGPLAIFWFMNARFGMNDSFGIYVVTGSLMAATLISLALSLIFQKRLPVFALVTGIFVMIFGFLTIYFEELTFIKIKPTIVNLLFASILAGGLFFRRPILKYALGEVLQLRDEGWRILTFRWIGFFIFLAILNEVIWRNFSTDTWVSFKAFGMMPLTFFFAMSQITTIMRYQITDGPSDSTEASASAS